MGAMGAILKKMAIFLKENALRVNHFQMGAILKKMAVFLKENALRVNHFLDGGDLEENVSFA